MGPGEPAELLVGHKASFDGLGTAVLSLMALSLRSLTGGVLA
jgi:hypothetical protein